MIDSLLKGGFKLSTLSTAVGGVATWLGFGVKGIAAGSAAAGMQSTIGNVAAGSIFAAVQSLGATGFFVTAGVFGVAGAAVFGTLLFVKKKI